MMMIIMVMMMMMCMAMMVDDPDTLIRVAKKMWQVPHPPTGLWSNIVDLRGKNTQKGFSQLQIFVPYSTVNVFLAVVPMQYIHYGLARCTLTLNLMAHLNVSYLPDPPNSARAWYSGRSMPDIKHLGRLLLCTSMYLGVPQCTSCLYLNV